MNLNENIINYLTIILCILLFIICIISIKNIEPIQFNIVCLIILFIVISCGLSIYYHEKFFVKNKICYNRNKEYLDYKDKIFDRVKNLKDIEENNRKGVFTNFENWKLKEMDILNFEYLANGENF